MDWHSQHAHFPRLLSNLSDNHTLRHMLSVSHMKKSGVSLPHEDVRDQSQNEVICDVLTKASHFQVALPPAAESYPFSLQDNSLGDETAVRCACKG